MKIETIAEFATAKFLETTFGDMVQFINDNITRIKSEKKSIGLKLLEVQSTILFNKKFQMAKLNASMADEQKCSLSSLVTDSGISSF